MKKYLKLVSADVVQDGLIQVNMKDNDSNCYYFFFDYNEFFSRLGKSMYSSHKEWTAKENLRKFTYTKDYKE